MLLNIIYFSGQNRSRFLNRGLGGADAPAFRSGMGRSNSNQTNGRGRRGGPGGARGRSEIGNGGSQIRNGSTGLLPGNIANGSGARSGPRRNVQETAGVGFD